jgi:hypothetical protein
MIRFACPSCGKKMRADENLAGSQLACSRCETALTIPPSLPPVQGALETPPEMTNGFMDDEEQILAPQAAPPPVEETWQMPTPDPSTQRPFSVLGAVFGVAGACLLMAGSFYPLVLMPMDVKLEALGTVYARVAAAILGVVALLLSITRKYAGNWVLGPGALLSVGGAFLVFYFRLREMVTKEVSARGNPFDAEGKQWIAERIGETMRAFGPGMGFYLMATGGLLLTLSAWIGTRRRRYEWPG